MESGERRSDNKIQKRGVTHGQHYYRSTAYCLKNLGFKSFPINFNLILFLHLKSIICKVHEVTTRK